MSEIHSAQYTSSNKKLGAYPETETVVAKDIHEAGSKE